MSSPDVPSMTGVHVVVMGVSGSGKSTVAAALAERLTLPFGEGDEFHGERNRALMAAGVPLTDADRAPWLLAVRDWMSAQAPTGSVVACSALRRAYRDVLRGALGDVLFLEVDVPAAVLRARMSARTEHFMPVSLLDSQTGDPRTARRRRAGRACRRLRLARRGRGGLPGRGSPAV
ncbi:gluconokinase [Cellulomonas soli]